VAQWGKQIEEDIELSVKHVLKKFPIDQKRICIMGASYGGYSALMSTIKYPKRYICAISSFGVTDLSLLFSSTNIYQIPDVRKNIINVVGDVPNDVANAKKFSPVYRAREIDIPVLILAGGKDRTAHPEHSERLHYVMKKLGKDSQYEFYRDSGHGHPTLNGIKHEILRKIEFLTTHLVVSENHSAEDKKLLADENLFQATQYRPTGVVEKDLERMVKLSRLAANNGNAEAKYLVGNYYEHGVSVNKNYGKAVLWYKKAAESNHKLAILKIAKAYKYGSLGLTKSPAEALRYYKQAAKQNSFVGAYQMVLLMICNDEKESALKLIYGMKKTADNYSNYSVSELERTTRESLDCRPN
jgi:dienelactone hydrolase